MDSPAHIYKLCMLHNGFVVPETWLVIVLVDLFSGMSHLELVRLIESWLLV